MHTVILGISGASCMPLARTLISILAALPEIRLGCIVSAGAERVWEAECNDNISNMISHADMIWDADDLAAGPASGSWWNPAMQMSMAIVPCSMGTLGALASGYCANLIHRTADVVLKEKGKLLLVPRESPLSTIHIRNMLVLARAGATIMPFSPSFYLKPTNLDEMLEQFSWRILDQLRIPHPWARWGSPPTSPPDWPDNP